jgi:hypothetical protein
MRANAENQRDELSKFTWLVILLALIHLPVVVFRVGLLGGGDGPWLEVIILGGPVLALAGSVVLAWRRSTRMDAMMCALVLAGYCLAYGSCYLAA